MNAYEDRCNQTDKEVRYLIEDWQMQGLTGRLEVLLRVAAEDRNIPTDGDVIAWIQTLAHHCGLRTSLVLRKTIILMTKNITNAIGIIGMLIALDVLNQNLKVNDVYHCGFFKNV